MNNNWQDELKKEFNENPLKVVAVGALAATAFAKVIDAWSSAKSKRAYARNLDYGPRRRR